MQTVKVPLIDHATGGPSSQTNLHINIIQSPQHQFPISEDDEFHADDRCLVTLLEAMCLKHLGSPEKAEGLLKRAISRHSGSAAGRLRSDTYLLPYATLEYGLILRDRGETAAALEQFERAK